MICLKFIEQVFMNFQMLQ